MEVTVTYTRSTQSRRDTRTITQKVYSSLQRGDKRMIKIVSKRALTNVSVNIDITNERGKGEGTYYSTCTWCELNFSLSVGCQQE